MTAGGKKAALFSSAGTDAPCSTPTSGTKSGRLTRWFPCIRTGRLIAGFLEKCGLGTIGGSSNGNAVGSARDLLESLRNDTAICIIPDGPKGPSMKLSKSPVYFAQKSGKPVFGIACSVKGSKIVRKAWDQMMIPIPFSEGVCEVIGPYYVPPEADERRLEEIRLQIENELNKVCFAADKAMGIEKVTPA